MGCILNTVFLYDKHRNLFLIMQVDVYNHVAICINACFFIETIFFYFRSILLISADFVSTLNFHTTLNLVSKIRWWDKAGMDFVGPGGFAKRGGPWWARSGRTL